MSTQVQSNQQGQNINRTGIPTINADTPPLLPATGGLAPLYTLQQNVVCFLQSPARLCTANAEKEDAIPPSCLLGQIFDNRECSSMPIDSANSGSGKFLIGGAFCENHLHSCQNMALRVLVADTTLRVVPLAVHPHKRATGMYPLLCAQPLDAPIEHFRQIFNGADRPGLNSERLSSYFCVAARAIRAEYKPSEMDKAAMQGMVEYAMRWGPFLAQKLSGCWQHDLVRLYFTKEYAETNKRNVWIATVVSKYSLTQQNADDNIITVDVPLIEFPVLDILAIKSYTPARIKPANTSDIITWRMPNVQIFNGIFYYGMGWGINCGLPDRFKRFSLDGLPYDKTVCEILAQRKNVANFTELVLDSTAATTQLPLVKFSSFCINTCAVTPQYGAIQY